MPGTVPNGYHKSFREAVAICELLYVTKPIYALPGILGMGWEPLSGCSHIIHGFPQHGKVVLGVRSWMEPVHRPAGALNVARIQHIIVSLVREQSCK